MSDATAEYQRAYRQANKERLSAQKRAHYEVNRESVKARVAEYRAANREEILRKRRAHHAVNREEILERRRAYAAENRDAIRKGQREYYRNNSKHRNRAREASLRKSGFTFALKEHAIGLQNGCCAICGCSLDTLPDRHVHADHCHATGYPRGVLCHGCNTGLGGFRDDPERLRAAIAYLDNPPLAGRDAG